MSDILNLARDYFESVFNHPGWAPFTFHSVHHTRSVIEKAEEWASASNLNITETESLMLAAMFHDLGYLSRYDNHEAEGIKMFYGFAEEHGLSLEQQEVVRRLIGCTLKTHLDFSDPLFKIMHDIDRAGMGMPDFIDQGLNLRKEWEHFKGLETNDAEWFAFQIDYLHKTHFKTEHGVQNYNNQKEKNLQSLKELLARLSN